MTRMKLIATTLAALLIGGTAAEAACKPSHVANRKFVISATDTSDVNKYFLYCGFTTSAAGTVSMTPSGCLVSRGSDAGFGTASPIDIYSGSFAQLPGGICVFDVNLSFGTVGPTMTGRIVFESGKTTATGSWVSTFGSWGTMSMMRQ